MSDELTEQQREFCRLVAKGISGRKSYAQAYGCSEASAGASASRMLKRANIQQEINRLTTAARELSRQRDAEAIGDRQQRMEMLWRMAKDSEAAGNVDDAVDCIKELNRMDGAHEPEKVEVTQEVRTFGSLLELVCVAPQT